MCRFDCAYWCAAALLLMQFFHAVYALRNQADAAFFAFAIGAHQNHLAGLQ
jgi:hypothetical protein